MTEARDGGAVVVNVRSLRKAHRQKRHVGFWLLFRAKSAAADTVFFDILDDLARQIPAEQRPVTELGVRTAKGWVTMVNRVPSVEALVAWAEDLAERLQAAGLRGTLQEAPSATLPRWLFAPRARPDPAWERTTTIPSAFVAWIIDVDQVTNSAVPGAEWAVPAPSTSWICDTAVHWARQGGPETLMSHSVNFAQVADDPALPRLLGTKVSETTSRELICYDPSARRGRRASLTPRGQSVFQLMGGEYSWNDEIAALRGILLALPELCNLAFIRPGVTISAFWLNLGMVQPLVDLHMGDVMQCQHLLADYTIDAHGIQVLTDTHLAKAHDLTDWHITDLGHGRHLVEARNLEPWYRQRFPDPATVRKAREDFGPMILTHQIHAEHPAPWNQVSTLDMEQATRQRGPT